MHYLFFTPGTHIKENQVYGQHFLLVFYTFVRLHLYSFMLLYKMKLIPYKGLYNDENLYFLDIKHIFTRLHFYIFVFLHANT